MEQKTVNGRAHPRFCFSTAVAAGIFGLLLAAFVVVMAMMPVVMFVMAFAMVLVMAAVMMAPCATSTLLGNCQARALGGFDCCPRLQDRACKDTQEQASHY
ncbi:MAG: hypothetical protein PHD76_06985 [Methylacidiphilales bacterium]|nr:hypothetical protein [Candidatus Methylacidiphilales bacterium]